MAYGVTQGMIAAYGDLVFDLSLNKQVRRGDQFWIGLPQVLDVGMTNSPAPAPSIMCWAASMSAFGGKASRKASMAAPSSG